jgi:hypothetical protein
MMLACRGGLHLAGVHDHLAGAQDERRLQPALLTKQQLVNRRRSLA